MDILLTGTEEWAIDRVRRSLTSSSHVVHSCFGDGDDVSSCNATTGCGECPATMHIDAIVAVRAHPLPHLTRREKATPCPMLDGVPLVVAGSTVLNPFGERARTLVEGYDEIESACLEVTAATAAAASPHQ